MSRVYSLWFVLKFLGLRVQVLGFRAEGLGFTQRLRKLGQLGCHQLDELLLPTLRAEDLEVPGSFTQHGLADTGHAFHCCLVVAHEVEQRAHLPFGLLRSPACLSRA